MPKIIKIQWLNIKVLGDWTVHFTVFPVSVSALECVLWRTENWDSKLVDLFIHLIVLKSFKQSHCCTEIYSSLSFPLHWDLIG